MPRIIRRTRETTDRPHEDEERPRLRMYRLTEGMTAAAEMAKLPPIPREYIARLEQGETGFSVTRLLQLARSLGVEAFLFLNPEARDPATAGARIEDPAQALKAYAQGYAALLQKCLTAAERKREMLEAAPAQDVKRQARDLENEERQIVQAERGVVRAEHEVTRARRELERAKQKVALCKARLTTVQAGHAKEDDRHRERVAELEQNRLRLEAFQVALGAVRRGL